MSRTPVNHSRSANGQWQWAWDYVPAQAKMTSPGKRPDVPTSAGMVPFFAAPFHAGQEKCGRHLLLAQCRFTVFPDA